MSTDFSFCVLSDQSIVIGISRTDQNTIIKQSITDSSEPTFTYTTNMQQVFTLAVNEPQNVLYAGNSCSNYDGKLVQFDLSTGQVVKAFGSVGIGIIWSSLNLNNLWFFGAHESSRFIVIDSVSRQVLGKPVKSAMWSINSMAVCKKPKRNNISQVLLFTVGDYSNYSKSRTDVFDITTLVDKYSNFRKSMSLLKARESIEDQ